MSLAMELSHNPLQAICLCLILGLLGITTRFICLEWEVV